MMCFVLCLSGALYAFFLLPLLAEATEPEKMDTDSDSQQADKVRPLLKSPWPYESLDHDE